MMYRSLDHGGLYYGDMIAGDREATQQEIDAWQLALSKLSAQMQIGGLEELQLRKSLRSAREERLKAMEAEALATLALTPTQLYAAASQPNAPTALKSYKQLKDIDNQIVALRAQL